MKKNAIVGVMTGTVATTSSFGIRVERERDADIRR